MARRVTVVCGVIEREGSILIGRKVEGEHPARLGGKWHFPGGIVEEGESLEEALKREIKEETNLSVEIGKPLGSYSHVRIGAGATLFFFRCVPVTHDAVAADDLQAVKWVDKRKVLKNFEEHYVQMLPQELIAFLEESEG